MGCDASSMREWFAQETYHHLRIATRLGGPGLRLRLCTSLRNSQEGGGGGGRRM